MTTLNRLMWPMLAVGNAAAFGSLLITNELVSLMLKVPAAVMIAAATIVAGVRMVNHMATLPDALEEDRRRRGTKNTR